MPIIIGLLIAPLLEDDVVRTLASSGGALGVFLLRPNTIGPWHLPPSRSPRLSATS